MKKPSRIKRAKTEPSRRRYNSPHRRARAEKTRADIIAAGTALAREATTWDWRDLTVRAIADRAGASERTVYRHFTSERQLHEAMMRQLEEDAGVTYEGIKLDEITGVAARVFSSISSFAVPPPVIRDQTFLESNRRRQNSLLEALEQIGSNWSPSERSMAAAVLDILWVPTSHERLMSDWNLNSADATRAVAWVIDLVIRAFREGARPPSASGRAKARAMSGALESGGFIGSK